MSKTRLVHGVGINDADYCVTKYNSRKQGGSLIWACPFYVTWKGMLKRCYYSKYHEHHPSYLDCEVDKRWHVFSNFKNWMESQNFFEKQLDKDLLAVGNKIYGPDYCVFISSRLNIFMNSRRAGRGKYLIGVSANRGGFLAGCSNPFTGVRECSYHKTELEAHVAWKAMKHRHALKLAEFETDLRVVAALETRYSSEVDWTNE